MKQRAGSKKAVKNIWFDIAHQKAYYYDGINAQKRSYYPARMRKGGKVIGRVVVVVVVVSRKIAISGGLGT